MTERAETNEVVEASEAKWRNRFDDGIFGDRRGLSVSSKALERVMKPTINVAPRVLEDGEVILANGTSLGFLYGEGKKS